MSKPIGEIVSRIKRIAKGVKQDAFLTDRFIYSIILKHSSWIVKREDRDNKLMRFVSAFQPLSYVELIEVDTIEASCVGLTSGITIKRTKYKLPTFMQGYWGPLIRSVNSIDGSEQLDTTTPESYVKLSKQKNFKYNNSKYYWYINEHLYMPNIDWDAVKIIGIFDDDISRYNCEDCYDKSSCLPRQEQNFNVPDYLHAEIESLVLKDLGLSLQFPSDSSSDKQHPLR